MKVLTLVALCLAALCSPRVAVAETAAQACFERRPEPDSVRAMRLTADDRAGNKTVLILRLYGRRNAQGLGQLFVRVVQPESMRGTSLLMLQRADAESDIHLASPEHPTPRPIRGSERDQGMFGTDFSYEDLERVQHGWRPGAAEIVELPGEQIDDRATYVIEVRPRDSAWARIVFYLSQESCLPILIRYFERGKTLPTKEANLPPSAHVKHGDIWVAHDVLMRNRVTYTSTHLMVDSHKQEALLPDEEFTVEGLERAVRGDGKQAP